MNSEFVRLFEFDLSKQLLLLTYLLRISNLMANRINKHVKMS